MTSNTVISTGPLAGVEITPEYRAGIRLLHEGEPVVLVCGKAGTGKTTFIQYVLEELARKNIVVVAPTGVAALNSGGMTIHSFFRFQPKLLTSEDIARVNLPIYRAMDLLIVDEVSMVRADMMDAMDLFLRINRREPNLPFGGVQVLLVGDLYQLPPVVKEQAEKEYLAKKYQTPMFWSSYALQESGMAVLELGHIFRQQDERFTTLLNKIRLAESLDYIVPALNRATFPTPERLSPLITLTSTNRTADEINMEQLSALPPDFISGNFYGHIEGEFNLSRDRLPAPELLELKAGAQVMCVRNDPEHRWVNGTLGQVVGLNFDAADPSVTIEILDKQFAGQFVDVRPMKWEMYRYEFDTRTMKIKRHAIGSYTQIPLILAWAITIHKSQGKTLERVMVDLGYGAFAPGQVYVALSRCRSLADLTLQRPLRKNEVMCDQNVTAFFNQLQVRAEGEIPILQYGSRGKTTLFESDETGDELRALFT